MKDFLLVGIGGFIGAVARYGIALLTIKTLPDKGYIGTLTVNLLGSLLIGMLAGGLIKSNQLNLLVVVGFCGAFTTFSTFSMDGLKLLKEGLNTAFISYSLISVFGGLLLCFLGFWLISKQ